MSVNGHVRLPVFLSTIPAENQFLNFCGQPCARLNADTPLFGEQKWNRRLAFRAVNLFLFGSPNEHAVRLQRVWVDGIIIQPRWKDFINRLKEELGRYTIFVSLVRSACRTSYGSQSTVMLAVNFSFLAVPGVVTPGSAASSIEIIIYCSVVSTVASIVFSFGLLGVYSNPRLMGARYAVCLHGRRPQLPGMFTFSMIAGCHVDAQSSEIGNGVSCNHAQPSGCLPHMVVRHPNHRRVCSRFAYMVLESHFSSRPSRYKFSVGRNAPLS